MVATARQGGTLAEVARRHGATWAQVTLAWLLVGSPATLAIPGTSSLAHLEANGEAGQARLSEVDLTELGGLAATP
jgi:pyridoxine 4-dehydrogenase